MFLRYLSYSLLGAAVMSATIIGCLTVKDKVLQLNSKPNCLEPNEITRIPTFKYTYQTQADCEMPDKNDVSLALTVFYIYWYDEFGDTGDLILENLNEMFIEWSPELMTFNNGYDINGNFIAEGKASGLAFGKKHIQVYLGKEMEIYETSLVHELIHASIRALNHIHGDPDHEGKKYEGWTPKHTKMIKEINEELKYMMEPNDAKKD